MLVRAGFDVVEAESGYDALEKVEAYHPDLLVLDVMMPGMDGFAVCEKLRREPDTATLPIIMLSAKADVDSVKRGLDVGADLYLAKPISHDELTRHVREVLVTSKA